MPKLKKQSTERQNEGVWVQWEGIWFRIARANNSRAVQILDEHAATNRALREEKKPQVPFDKVWLDVLSQAILVGWEDLEGDDGLPIPYSPEKAREYLSDPIYSDLKLFVETESSRRSNFIEQGDKVAEKNSQALSSRISPSMATSAESSKSGPQGEKAPSSRREPDVSSAQ